MWNSFEYILEQKYKDAKSKNVPDKAKLESAKPLVRIATTSQGGNPRSKEESVMQIAGDIKAIVWQIFRTYMFKMNNQNFVDLEETVIQYEQLQNWITSHVKITKAESLKLETINLQFAESYVWLHVKIGSI